MLMVTVGHSKKRPVVEENEIKIRNTIDVTLSLDHRYTDGARAMVIYNRFVQYLHDPEKMINEDLQKEKEIYNQQKQQDKKIH